MTESKEPTLIKMNKTIKRTIKTTNCEFKIITDVDGDLQGETKLALFDGELSLEKATELIKKELKDELLGKTFLVSKLTINTDMYELKQSDFIKYGLKVEPKENEETEYK